ncbi:AAA domain-containing protein [Mycena indigotica]|uniref:AAA domain-containing protein n=1 Tax=Mycena indigotica TaxID=2126181 RepID=A0A8H6TH79_9AGAR|nr:AAA domain-containing protein [Mycena indigotica]KAF7315700.1 AAA domain-containing protein [Mycena indigotica]
MSTYNTRSSVLGKRPYTEPTTPEAKLQLQTPDNTPLPKRPRISSTVVDPNANKENIPPFNTEPISSPSPRTTRALRRSTTLDGSPTRARIAITRRASTSTIVPPTPTVEIAELSLATPPPTPPSSLLPIHVQARALLRATCNSPATDMAAREEERAVVTQFFTSLVDENEVEHTSLYISGSPGTGKTALVNSVLRALSPDQVKVIIINCMALSTVEILWERIVEELGGNTDKKRKTAGRLTKLKGQELVASLLDAHRTKCIIVLDELDHIAPTPQVLSSLFSLSATRQKTARIIGIANTHTLTASSSVVPVAGNVRTLHFAPYTPTQLLQIIESRLAPMYNSISSDGDEASDAAKQAAKKFLSPPALTLLTKKIAALTGDVRSLFEVLRGAIDLAVSSAATQSPTRPSENPLNPTVTIAVSPSHILSALKAHAPSQPRNAVSAAPIAASSEVVSKVSSLGLHARLVLLALLVSTKRLEAGLSLSSSYSGPSSPVKRTTSMAVLGAIDPTQLHAFYSAILARSGEGVFSAVSRSEFSDLVCMLEGVGLVACGPSNGLPSGGPTTPKTKRTFSRSASFGQGGNKAGSGDIQLAQAVRTDEVLRGLGVGAVDANPDVAAEEVNAIWLKENARLTRDIAARETKSQKEKEKAVASFDDAMEH